MFFKFFKSLSKLLLILFFDSLTEFLDLLICINPNIIIINNPIISIIVLNALKLDDSFTPIIFNIVNNNIIAIAT